MIELGLQSGDPLAVANWTPDQQTHGYAWWLARQGGAPGLGLIVEDLRRVWREIVSAYGGLQAFLVGRRR